MKRNVFYVMCSFVAALFLMTACDETSEENEYDNWEVRNKAYLDSIANVAQTNASGDWKMLKSYTLPSDQAGSSLLAKDPLDYVFVKVLKSGTGATPLYNDTVRVHYRGSYINGTVFDQSYKGTLDLNTAMPSKFQTSALINGWTTALQQMKEGDSWMVYIPWSLAYGPGTMASSSSSILEYSMLVFSLDLVKVYPSDQYNSSNPVPEWR